ncbi:MAG: hypothetical protein HOL08_09920, partial [Opitutae bacterium]|nr:hypothetical protein [Opitutae bacterium]
ARHISPPTPEPVRRIGTGKMLLVLMLVPFLPLLGVTALFIRATTKSQPDGIRIQWLQYLNTLLFVSSLLTFAIGGYYLWKADKRSSHNHAPESKETGTGSALPPQSQPAPPPTNPDNPANTTPETNSPTPAPNPPVFKTPAEPQKPITPGALPRPLDNKPTAPTKPKETSPPESETTTNPSKILPGTKPESASSTPSPDTPASKTPSETTKPITPGELPNPFDEDGESPETRNPTKKDAKGSGKETLPEENPPEQTNNK